VSSAKVRSYQGHVKDRSAHIGVAQSRSGEYMSSQPLRSRSVHDYVRPGHIWSRYGLVRSDQFRSGQVKVKLDQIKSDQGHVRLRHVGSGQVMSGQVRYVHVKIRSSPL